MEMKRVLIVDDEKNIRMTLAQALDVLKLRVEAAVNGEEGLRKLTEGDFDLILLDLKMPGMDGMEVLRRVRRARPDIRIIIITAHGTIESATEAMKLGAVDFIQKPFAPREIRELVTKVLDRDAISAETAKGYEQHIQLAKKSIGERAFRAAREHVKQALAEDPTKPEALNILGALAEIDGDSLEALKQYRAAMALDPTYKPASENVHRIVTLHEQGREIDLGGFKTSKDS